MNLLLVERREISSGGTLRLLGRRARHLLDVVRVSPGRTLRAGVLDEGLASAEVLHVDSESVELRFGAVADPGPDPPPTRVLLALPRPKALRRIVATISSFGVERLELINAWRVPRSFFDSALLAPDRLRHEARIGAEQGGQIRLPEIRVHRLLMPFLDTLGPVDDETRLLAHPSAGQGLESTELSRSVLVALGPEGGWIEREIASFCERGFHPVQLGPWILRSETAVTAALAQIGLRRRLPVLG